MDNIVRFGSKVALIDLDSACCLPDDDPSNSELKFMGAGSHKFSTGIFPPEMIFKIDLGTQYHMLEQYQQYWRYVSEDAKDLVLLTPDDVQTITSVVKSILAKSDAVRNMGPSSTSLRYNMGERLAGLEDPNKDWKDILTLALITISFEDLPHSLTACNTVEKFAVVWGRLRANSRLWEKLRPRMSPDGKFAYVVKTFDDVLEERREGFNNGEGNEIGQSISSLPYDLIKPSEKIDIWSYGTLLYSLCSGGSLFHMGFYGDLRSSSAFADLKGWTSQRAEAIVHANVDDPLAQDLLLKILVPRGERLATMEAVLRHPFFGPSSGLEAQRILERHEEQQLVLEETVIIEKFTTESQRRLEFSTEKQCKIVFDEEKIVVPTCMMVLPYELQMNMTDNVLNLSNNHRKIDLAIEIGTHLLDINATTARLSFWLMMKKNLADRDGHEFKSKMKMWLKRARTEASEVVAREIVSAIGCGSEYIGLCVEMLEKGDAVSKARAYIKDPMSAAQKAIRASTQALTKCYLSQYLYLLDEYHGTPTISDNDNAADGDSSTAGRSTKTFNGMYPLRIDPSANLFQHLLLPFMNITVMTLIAIDGFMGLAQALGLPRSYGIPDKWRAAAPGLVHKKDKPSIIAEFAVLHDVIRKRERRAARKKAKLNGSFIGNADILSEEDGNSIATGSKSGMFSKADSVDGLENDGNSEMRQLEMFFRDYDSLRVFSDLRRVADGSEKGLAIWTTDDVVEQMQNDVELACIETRLRELKKEFSEQSKLQKEMSELRVRARQLRDPESLPPAPHIITNPDSPHRKTQSVSNRDIQFLKKIPPTDPRRKSMDDTNPNLTVTPSIQLTNPQTQSTPEKRKKMRTSNNGKQKLRIRPYFGVC